MNARHAAVAPSFLQFLHLLHLSRAQPMGQPLSEILIFSSDDEFRETVHAISSSSPCWAVLFVNGEEEQLQSISLLEVPLHIVNVHT